ncbi:MAG TPA: hypothetical protein VFY73_09310, partial [Ideonella sp.]|uniref:hypothetical protein n=1 Tax=Ideonella sp. TaxID=1929293 RepID=UPI002E374E48
MNSTTLSRRKALKAALAGAATPLITSAATPSIASSPDTASTLAPEGGPAGPARAAEWVLATPQGTLRVSPLSDRALRVRFLPPKAAAEAPPSLVLLPGRATPLMKQTSRAGSTRLELPAIR